MERFVKFRTHQRYPLPNAEYMATGILWGLICPPSPLVGGFTFDFWNLLSPMASKDSKAATMKGRRPLHRGKLALGLVVVHFRHVAGHVV